MPGMKSRSSAGVTRTSPARPRCDWSLPIWCRVLVVASVLLWELAESGSSLAESSGAASGDSVLLPLPPFSATLFDGDEPIGILSTIVILEISGEDERAAVLENLPKLRDAFIRALNQLAVNEGRLGQEYGPIGIKRAFQVVADHLLGQGVVDEVLVEGISRSRNS